MSKFLNLNSNDLLKGFVMACLGVVLTGIYNLMSTGGVITLEWLKTIGMSGLMAGIAYLVKNAFTNSDWQILTKESI